MKVFIHFSSSYIYGVCCFEKNLVIDISGCIKIIIDFQALEEVETIWLEGEKVCNLLCDFKLLDHGRKLPLWCLIVWLL